MFCENVDSVKYISEFPDIKIPEPLASLNNKTSKSFIHQNNKNMQKTNQ